MSKAKARNGAGSVERRGKLWWVMCTRPPGSKPRRKRLPIANSEKMTEAQAEREGAKLAKDVRDGKIVFDDRARRGAAPTVVSATTVRELADAWTSGALYERYGAVNRLRKKASAYVDKVTLNAHVMPVKTRGTSGPKFGDLRVVDVTPRDIVEVMAAQPKEHRAQTRLHIYQRLRRLFDLAIFPLELRKEGDNPVSRRLRPQADAAKEFGYLYPAELLALLDGRNAAGELVVPLVRRVLYATAVYTGFRRGSLLALTWANLDFDNRALTALSTKDKTPAFAEGEPPSLFLVLEAWRFYLGEPAKSTFIFPRAPEKTRRKLAKAEPLAIRAREIAEKTLQEDLHAVGVTRAMLFPGYSPNVEPLRFHDLRATFQTWARRAGWSQDRIERRTGHDDEETAARYTRGARTLAELRTAVFPDLTDAIPELSAEARRLHTALHTSPVSTSSAEPPGSAQVPVIPGCEGGDLNPYASYGASTSS